MAPPIDDVADQLKCAQRLVGERIVYRLLAQAFAQLREDAEALEKHEDPELGPLVRHGVRVQDPVRFLDSIAERAVNDQLSTQEAATILNLLLLLSQLEAAN